MITFVQASSSQEYGGTSLSVQLNGVTPGDAIVGSVVITSSSIAIANVTDNAPGGSDSYILVNATSSVSNNSSAASFYALNVKGGNRTVTIAFSTSTPGWSDVVITEVSGVAAVNALDGNSVHVLSDTGFFPSGTPITTTAGSDYIYGALVSSYEASGCNSCTAVSPFTTRISNANGYATEDQIQANAGSTEAQFTTTTGYYTYYLYTLAFKEGAPPSIPTNLTAIAVSPAEIDLSWASSTDPVEMAGYDIYRNGTFIASTTALSYNDTGLTAGTSYSYAIAAFDTAGNVSATSTSISATTQAAVISTNSPVVAVAAGYAHPAVPPPGTPLPVSSSSSVTASPPSISASGTSSPSDTVAASIRSEISLLTQQLQSLMAQAGEQGRTLSSAYAFTDDLSLWDRGPAVTALQEYLIHVRKGPAAEALANHGPSGVFGYLTYHALMEFQASHGIPATGFFGPMTRRYIATHG